MTLVSPFCSQNGHASLILPTFQEVPVKVGCVLCVVNRCLLRWMLTKAVYL